MKNFMQNIFLKIKKTVHKKYDTKKLDLKIASFEKKYTENLLKLGTLIYESRLNNTQIQSDIIDNLCNEIEALKHKKSNLLNQKQKKTSVIKPPKQFEQKETVYATLSRKESDLKIQRTSEGLKFLKFCPECQTGNNPNNPECISCGYQFHQ